MDYKKYSLENLENWIYDAMSAGEATPQEIYDVIVGVVKENYYTYKHQASQAYELLALLNGNGESITKDHYDGWDKGTISNRLDTSNLTCNKDDPSPECQGAWNDFWGTDNQYTEEELNAMCEAAASQQEKEKCREYNLREAEYYDKRAQLDFGRNHTYDEMIAAGYTMTADGFWILPQKEDKVKKWVLPTEVDGMTGDVIINLPDDLLEAANLKEGDYVEWIDNGDGSYLMNKVTQPIVMEEC